MADGTHTDGSASGGTHYDVLGVAADATPDEIEARFRELAKVVHPDAGGDRITFGVLYRSYEVLRDPERRAAFDAELAAGTHREVPTQTIASGSPRPLLRRSTSAQRERAQARAREWPPVSSWHLTPEEYRRVRRRRIVWLLVECAVGFVLVAIFYPLIR